MGRGAPEILCGFDRFAGGTSRSRTRIHRNGRERIRPIMTHRFDGVHERRRQRCTSIQRNRLKQHVRKPRVNRNARRVRELYESLRALMCGVELVGSEISERRAQR